MAHIMALDFNALANKVGVNAKPLREPTPPTEDETAPPNSCLVRPQDVADMIGQDRARVQLMTSLRAAQARGEAPGHFLFYGPPGLGKTTMGRMVAAHTGTRLHITLATAVNSPAKMAAQLCKLEKDDVLFIDEIHELSRPTQELLGVAMEDLHFEFHTGTGRNMQSATVNMEPFTVVGATTLAGNLTGPLLARFRNTMSLEYYDVDDLTVIVEKAAEAKKYKIAPDAAAELAFRSRGTPRIAIALLEKVAEYAVAIHGDPDAICQYEDVCDGLELYEIDVIGLNPDDRKVMQALCQTHMGGPVGIDNLAASAGIDRRTVRDMIEPFLIREELMIRSTRGRIATKKAYRHFGWKIPPTVIQ
jgi:Holliday junction DNA helicase RuvB